MHISTAGLLLVEEFEGFSATPYQDSVGVWTIGFGTTGADVSPLPRFLSRRDAQDLLARKLAEKYEPSVNGLGVPLNQNQFDALVSLAYNVGPGVMGWQIGRDLLARNYGAASADFMHYVYAGGQVLQGLVNRRNAERQLFDRPAGPPPDPHHYERYPNQAFLFGKLKVHERATVMEYDRRYPFIGHAFRKAILRGHIRLLRDRTWSLAHRNQPPAWHDGRNLGWRWNRLNDRLTGRAHH